MDYLIEERSESQIVGVSIRTTNEYSQAAKEIPAVWTDFFKNNTKDAIPNKSDNDLVGLYYDYESDFRGAYHFLVGCFVLSAESIPENMTVVTIPAGRYAVYSVEGDLSTEIMKTWEKIWTSDLKRTYKCDFEVYKQIGDKTTARIYVGIEE